MMPVETPIKCEQEGCDSTDTIECRLPDYEETGIFYHYCPKHAEANGFCVCCGEFWGGIESFEFWHPGLCDNCHDDIQAELGEYEDEEVPDYYYDNEDE